MNVVEEGFCQKGYKVNRLKDYMNQALLRFFLSEILFREVKF